MYQVIVIPVHVGITALVAAGHGVAIQIAVGHLATAHAAHAAAHLTAVHGAAAHGTAFTATANGHATAAAHAGHAVAPTHLAKTLHGVPHISANPMSRKLAELLAEGAATVGSLTFVNLYDHMLDAEWKKEQKRHRGVSAKRQRDLLDLAYRHTKIALEDIKQDTADELHKLARLRERVLAMLQPLTPTAHAAAA